MTRSAVRVLNNQRGMTMPLVAFSLSAIIALTAYMLDGSRISVTANEVQAAADISASAGAMALLSGADPQSQAVTVLSKNKINNISGTAVNLQSLAVGNWNGDTNVFTSNLFPLNAVRTWTTTSVSNILIGQATKNNNNKNSKVTKMATAAFRGVGSGRATLPIVIGECKFPKECYSNSCMPSLTQVPDPNDNSAWTGFYGGTGEAAIKDFFPPCSPKGGSGTNYNANVTAGTNINITNGQLNLMDYVSCLVNNNGQTTHVIPIIPCTSQYNQAQKVLGFATIVVDSVKSSGQGQGITLHAIFKATDPGVFSGGGNYGTGSIALVE